MRGSIRVVSKRSGGLHAADDEAVIPADRDNPLLGNRHRLYNHRDSNERAEVIAAHGVDLDEDLRFRGPISIELDKLASRVAAGEKIALACWCTPRPRHADRYVAIVRERAAAITGCQPDDFIPLSAEPAQPGFGF